MKTFEEIRKFLEGLCDDDILCIWNDIARYNGATNEVFYMSDLDEIFYGISISEFLGKIDRDFDFNDCYFYDSICGIASTSDIYDVVDIDELAYILEQDWGLWKKIYNSDLDEFMNEETEEEAEE